MLVTYTGKIFDYDNITADSICLDDIIHAICKLNRFVGHSSRPYTVGEHTYYCLLMAEKLGFNTKQKLQVLMHDFSEAYVGDCPSPLKKHLKDFKTIEKKVEKAIWEHFGLPLPTEEEHKLIKRVDLTMLVIEMRDLTHHDYRYFITENTYLEILEDEDFNLRKNNVPEKLEDILFSSFHKLMDENKKEQEGAV